MKAHILGIICVLFCSLLSPQSEALIPPLSPAELDKQADLVVVGRVEKVEPAGKPYKDHCYTWRDYRATFSVDKYVKGNSKTKIQIHFFTRIKSDGKCVGGRTFYFFCEKDS